MKITLKNIGIIKDSTVAIDGITVITGKNNSGKSTFGKAVYSVVSATENLYMNATRDIVEFAEGLVTNRLRANEMNILFRRANNLSFNNYGILKDVYNHHYPRVSSIPELKDMILFIISAAEGVSLDKEDGLLLKSILLKQNEIEESKEKFSKDLHEVLDLIDQYSDFIQYEQRKLTNTLMVEYNGQLTPVKLKDITDCEIIVQTEDNEYSVKIDVKGQQVKYSGSIPFSEDDNVIFIDDVTILDNIRLDTRRRGDLFFGVEEFDFYIDASKHDLALSKKLEKEAKGIIGAMVDEDRYREVETLINTVINDDIVEKENRYVFSSDGLELSNLATGAKAFAILKMLLMNGSINKNTILILDEPESHLHPEWQNLFAQIVALLVKEIGIKVILTSHSPNFVLAMQTYSMKYRLGDVTNFYTTVKDEDGYRVDYKLVDDMSEVYADFAKFFSQIKAKYEILKYGDVND